MEDLQYCVSQLWQVCVTFAEFQSEPAVVEAIDVVLNTVFIWSELKTEVLPGISLSMFEKKKKLHVPCNFRLPELKIKVLMTASIWLLSF